ncbi:staygreen family protein [Neobacillus sp. LXY-1]|uniref:staygreen family protein n=1 Tax=Neobacillus sp. LXY-1 TaxID=3379133 RepID=UPI003EE414E0
MFPIVEFNPNKLKIKTMPYTSNLIPIQGRKYTLTHSDRTGELYLSIGFQYDMSTINKNIRDEFLAEIILQNNQYFLQGKVYVSGGEFNEQTAKKRYIIFQRELRLAITAIIYGDWGFFFQNPHLLDANIMIHFESDYPSFNQILCYGTPRHYISTFHFQTS